MCLKSMVMVEAPSTMPPAATTNSALSFRTRKGPQHLWAHKQVVVLLDDEQNAAIVPTAFIISRRENPHTLAAMHNIITITLRNGLMTSNDHIQTISCTELLRNVATKCDDHVGVPITWRVVHTNYVWASISIIWNGIRPQHVVDNVIS